MEGGKASSYSDDRVDGATRLTGGGWVGEVPAKEGFRVVFF